MSRLSFKVVEEALKKRPIPAATPNERPSRYYAKYVFNHEKMRKYLPLEAYQRYCATLDKNFRANSSGSKSPMPPPSPTAASAPLSRRAATLLGIRQAPSSSSATL